MEYRYTDIIIKKQQDLKKSWNFRGKVRENELLVTAKTEIVRGSHHSTTTRKTTHKQSNVLDANRNIREMVPNIIERKQTHTHTHTHTHLANTHT